MSLIDILEATVDRPLNKLVLEIANGENADARRLVTSFFAKADLSTSEMVMDIAEQLSIAVMTFLGDTRKAKRTTVARTL